MAFTIEKDWITNAGYQAVVIMYEGNHCGYVGLPTTHPLHGKKYSEVCEHLAFPSNEPFSKRGILSVICAQGEARIDAVFDVHGSITYSNSGDFPIKDSKLWWFGFDCNHYFDAKSPEWLAEQQRTLPQLSLRSVADGVFRDLDYCVAECESLAQQMITRVFATYQQPLLPAPK